MSRLEPPPHEEDKRRQDNTGPYRLFQLRYKPRSLVLAKAHQVGEDLVVPLERGPRYQLLPLLFFAGLFGVTRGLRRGGTRDCILVLTFQSGLHVAEGVVVAGQPRAMTVCLDPIPHLSTAADGRATHCGQAVEAKHATATLWEHPCITVIELFEFFLETRSSRRCRELTLLLLRLLKEGRPGS